MGRRPRRKVLRTYKLVPTDDPPVAGEIRYVIDWVPNPAEPLAQLLPREQRMIWTGKEWVKCEA